MQNKKFLSSTVLCALGAFVGAAGISTNASATPAFAVQTGQPCSACHVGAYGPQLTPFGRDFKLYGYTADDGKSHWPPVAIMERTTFTHTQDKQDGGAAPGFGDNNNAAIGEVSLFYTGKITDHVGAYLEPVSYDGVAHDFGWANSEVRGFHEGSVFHNDYVVGFTVNNAPTVSDLWNSTPQWGWPFDSSALAPTPAAQTLLGDGVAQFNVIGGGAYAMIDDWVYLEADLYRGLSVAERGFLGVTPVSGSDSYETTMPYWRAAIQHEFDHHHQYFEIGTLGMIANLDPGGTIVAGEQDKKTDIGFDANYQWFGKDNDNIISGHAIYVHEKLDLNASSVLGSSNPSDVLQEFKANVSYAYKQTWIPTVGCFHTWGNNDANGYWNTSTGSSIPNSTGYTAELTYVPFGKPDSPFPGFNGRLELQYVGYTQFDGVGSHAAANNTIFLNLGLFIDPVPYLTGEHDANAKQ